MQQMHLVVGDRAERETRDPRLAEGVLSALALFRNVSPRQVSELASHTRTRKLGRGTVICSRGERLPGLFVMAYGMAKLALRRADGEEKVLRFLGANEFFGAAPVFLDRPCPVDVVALADSLLAVVPTAPLLRLLELDPIFARNLVLALADGVLELVAEIETNVQRSGVQRLASYLESLAQPAASAKAWAVRLPASKTLVAARLGITKETMSRLLRDLVDQGLISVAGREILLLDRSRLALIAA